MGRSFRYLPYRSDVYRLLDVVDFEFRRQRWGEYDSSIHVAGFASIIWTFREKLVDSIG
jgi:hypothetical protein